MNFILEISKEIKRKLKVVLPLSIIDELHSPDIHRDEMEVESGVIRSIIAEIQCSDLQGDQKEGGIGITRSIIDELYFLDIQGD